jgi:hypothetical protein
VCERGVADTPIRAGLVFRVIDLGGEFGAEFVGGVSQARSLPAQIPKSI